MVLFLGPWSAGKSTMINYLAGLDEDIQLPTGECTNWYYLMRTIIPNQQIDRDSVIFML